MKFIPIIIAAIIALLGLRIRFGTHKKIKVTVYPTEQQQARSKKIGMIVFTLGIWIFVGCLITLVFGRHAQEEFNVSIIPPRANFIILGYQPSETMVVGWGVMAALIFIAVIVRLFLIPKLTDVPGKFQNIIEAIIEVVENYTSERTPYLGSFMYCYIFVIGVTLFGNLIAELMGFRSPSSDLTFTAALSIMAFLMSNYYGIRKLSLKGRFKSFAHPSPMLIPIKLVTDLANPLSMACRLFGNTLSGMIVLNLIYSALGNFATGIPSIVGLYFNVFSALIQMIIFITLTLMSFSETTTAVTE